MDVCGLRPLLPVSTDITVNLQSLRCHPTLSAVVGRDFGQQVGVLFRVLFGPSPVDLFDGPVRESLDVPYLLFLSDSLAVSGLPRPVYHVPSDRGCPPSPLFQDLVFVL